MGSLIETAALAGAVYALLPKLRLRLDDLPLAEVLERLAAGGLDDGAPAALSRFSRPALDDTNPLTNQVRQDEQLLREALDAIQGLLKEASASNRRARRQFLWGLALSVPVGLLGSLLAWLIGIS